MRVLVLIFREYLESLCNMWAVRTSLDSFADFYENSRFVLQITALTKAGVEITFQRVLTPTCGLKQKSAVLEHQL